MYLEAIAVLFTLRLALVAEGFTAVPLSLNLTMERQVMFKLRDSFGATAPKGWSSDNHCQWSHIAKDITMPDIICDFQGRVIEIQLIGQPPDFFLESSELVKDLPALTGVTKLTIIGHNIQARIPPEWGSWSSLQMLALGQLSLIGPLPGSFADLANLTVLDLGNNKLSGPMPNSFSRLKKLQSIDLSNNLWDASVLPPSLAGLSDLRAMTFEGANLIGGIPTWLRNMTLLQIVNFQVNKMDGTVPAWLLDGTMPNLTRVTLNNNEFYGSLPTRLSPTLQMAYLQNNFFQGAVPTPSSNVTEYVYAFNCFTGSIFADIQQKTPEQCQHFYDSLAAPASFHAPSRAKTAVPFIVAGTIFLILMIVLIGLLVLYLKKRRQPRTITFQNVDLSDGVVKPFSIWELRRATGKFTTEIGRGGFATVYQAKLRDGTDVAVKRLASRRSGYDPNAMDEFDAFEREVALIARLHHRFLVNLLGYCIDNDERMLIFEYIPNGTLSQALFGSRTRNILPWGARMRIAVHVAKGIEYLHYGANPPVLHRDIKSGNILLGEDYSAKVADFGLSRETRVNESADGPLTTGTLLKGTLGYTDPEYMRTGKLSEKSDVYSFGIVLLELLTGKRAKTTHPYPGSTATSLGDWCQFYYRNPSLLAEMVDARLNGGFDWDELRIVASVAHDCVYLDSADRPNMREVVDHLQLVCASEKASEGDVAISVEDTNIDSSASLSASHKTGSESDSHTFLNLVEKEQAVAPHLPSSYSTDYSSRWNEILAGGALSYKPYNDQPGPNLSEDQEPK